MPKRTLFTNITPLPASVSREIAIALLHNHDEMIELNPLVIEHHPIKTPRDAPADEFLDCTWQELTDRIHYLPGGMAKGKVSYKACFHDMPNGLQTHIYAPMGLDIREKWTVGGSLPGEPSEPRELGVNVPLTGLYIREDGDMKCNIMLSSFVRKNLDNAHKVLVERILKKAERVEETIKTMGGTGQTPITPASTAPGTPRFQAGSHMSKSAMFNNPNIYGIRPLSPQMMSPQQDLGWQMNSMHPAYRPQMDDKRYSSQSLPPYQSNGQYPPNAHHQRMSYYGAPPQQSYPQEKQQPPPSAPKEFMAELPGSTYHTMHLGPPPQQHYHPHADPRFSMVSELSSADERTLMGSPPLRGSASDRGSTYSNDNLKVNGHNGAEGSVVSGHSGGYDGSRDRGSVVSELPSDYQR